VSLDWTVRFDFVMWWVTIWLGSNNPKMFALFCAVIYPYRDHWGDPDADGRIILRWISRRWEGVVRTGWTWLRIGTGGGHL